jgi:hypothetical protein
VLLADEAFDLLVQLLVVHVITVPVLHPFPHARRRAVAGVRRKGTDRGSYEGTRVLPGRLLD